MSESIADVQYGTLDLMVLTTLESMGPLHGYGIARRIEQVAQGLLALNQGTIYPALVRLEHRGWIDSDRVRKLQRNETGLALHGVAPFDAARGGQPELPQCFDRNGQVERAQWRG